MTTFILLAAGLLALALAILLPPLLRRPTDGTERARILPVLSLAVIFAASAFGLYAWLGTPEGIRADLPEAGPGSVRDAMTQLEQRLREQPDNLEGWMLLGRSRMATGDSGGAVNAYRRARELAPREPVVLVALAEAIAQSDGHRLAGEPEALLEEALRYDPANQRALWFSGIAAWQSGDYEAAAGRWERLLDLLEPGSDVAASVREQLAAARQQAGMTTPGTVDSGVAGDAPGEAPARDQPAPGDASVRVSVSVAETLRDRVGIGNLVFVFARPSGGPGMPLAVKRFPASELPVTLSLGPDDAMTPQNALKSGMEVVVTARISKTGSATPQAGDLQGATGPFAVGETGELSIVIDRELETP